MLSFLKRLLDRYAQKVNRSAAGSPVPAGLEPRRPGERPAPSARERTLMRRRLRAVRRRREALMHEVGGLVLDSRHSEPGASERLDGCTKELEDVDAEARALAEALREMKALDELLASGVASRCPSGGELVAGRERHCASCGSALPRARGAAKAEAQKAPARTHAPAPTTRATGASSARAPTRPAR